MDLAAHSTRSLGINGVYLPDTIAESVLLPGFKVDVTTCFKEAEL